jgi:Lar family restriction alleviation protein
MRPLPCPFCGNEPSVYEPLNVREYVEVHCNSSACAAEPTVYAPTKEDAVEQWNRRPSTQK